MQQTLVPTLEVVVQATNRVQGSSKRLLHLLSFVPDDKLNWTPSASAKSPLRVVAHCAVTNSFFARTIGGNVPEAMPTPGEFFDGLSAAEAKITTREDVITLLQETTTELCEAIETVNAENIDSAPDSPFGPLPMQFWLDQSGGHLVEHTGQLTYLQTIWGDLDNHFG